MPAAYTNRHGRRPGRGIRPWMLIPKVLCVAIYFGALAATLALWVPTDFTPPLSPAATATVIHASLLVRFVAVPALLLAICFGVALLLQHPREFLRMRWLGVKLTLLAIGVPGAHFYLWSRMGHVRAGGPDAARCAIEFTVGLVVTIVGSATVIVLGRLKPRLGQNYAATYGTRTTFSSRPSPKYPSATPPG